MSKVEIKKHADGLVCAVCGRQFDRPSRLRAHLLTHTGEKPVQCPICGKGFASKGNCTTHMRTHTREKPYQCTHCDKKYSQHSQLVIHIRAHTGEKPYVCSVCKKAFTCSKVLKNHLRTHSGEKPFSCEFCDKGFATYGNMVVHRRTHTKEKPYVCNLCGRGFEHSGNLSRHCKGHLMPDGSVRCMLCGQVFKEESDLTYHSFNEHSSELEKDYEEESIPESGLPEETLQGLDTCSDVPIVDNSPISFSSAVYSDIRYSVEPGDSTRQYEPNGNGSSYNEINLPSEGKTSKRKKNVHSTHEIAQGTVAQIPESSSYFHKRIINKSPLKIVISKVHSEGLDKEKYSSQNTGHNSDARIPEVNADLPRNQNSDFDSAESGRVPASGIETHVPAASTTSRPKKSLPPDLIPIEDSEEIILIEEESAGNPRDLSSNSLKFHGSKLKIKSDSRLGNSSYIKLDCSSPNFKNSPERKDNKSSILKSLRMNMRESLLSAAEAANQRSPNEFKRKAEFVLRLLIGEDKLVTFGYPGKNIEQVLVSVLDVAGMNPCADVRIDEIERLKLNSRKLLEWVITDPLEWEKLTWGSQSIENILDKLHQWYTCSSDNTALITPGTDSVGSLHRNGNGLNGNGLNGNGLNGNGLNGNGVNGNGPNREVLRLPTMFDDVTGNHLGSYRYL